MALVQKQNATRNTISIVLLAVILVAAALYGFRDKLFPPTLTVSTETSRPRVQTLPIYPDSGAEVLNTNDAKRLTPYGTDSVTPCTGRTNPFDLPPATVACP